jgi:hypothetical protein
MNAHIIVQHPAVVGTPNHSCYVALIDILAGTNHDGFCKIQGSHSGVDDSSSVL